MPRFVSNGPVVPDRLVQDLEDDRVIIFCGAGISMGAGLPDYVGLVRDCYTELGQSLPSKKSSEWLWPDRMLGELEAYSDATTVRRYVAQRLAHDPKSLQMHEAILQLARLKRQDGIRLVTTNFDTYFEKVRDGFKLGVDFHSGPILPIPRNDQNLSWKSIVYLHGRLNPADQNNDHLVLTSADFGRAYLTDAWAARFVARLFSDFTVLFVGYSLNDPVLRYMTDAFAAENASSRTQQQGGPAYIFVPHKGQAPNADRFRHRNLHPIFYNQYRYHSRLQKTLVAWAKARENYLANTSLLINRIAPNTPNSLDPSDTANLLWAVVGRPDDVGNGARTFANIAVAPPIDWMDEFDRQSRELATEYQDGLKKAMSHCQATPNAPNDPFGSLFPLVTDRHDLPISETASYLMSWLTRHLNNFGLVERIIAKLNEGRCLHQSFRFSVARRLSKETELKDGFFRFWRIVSSEGDWARGAPNRKVIYHLRSAIKSKADITWIKQEILAQFKPIIVLKPSFYRAWSESSVGESNDTLGEFLGQLADAEVELSCNDSLQLIVEDIAKHGDGDHFWASLLSELTQLTTQVLDLYAIAGEASNDSDPSTYQRPSIIPHDQNRHHQEWTKLIDLIWSGWTYLEANDKDACVHWISVWRRIPYLLFRRLVLAASHHTSHLSPSEKLEILLNG